MKLFTLLFLLPLLVTAQDAAVTNWINSDAVAIDNTDISNPIPDNAHLNNLFKGRKVFGFGEATHHTKEFFELKFKFFRYLAEHEGVRTFLMEDSYFAGNLVNNFILGGEGSAAEVAARMGFLIWRTEEVSQLIQWMRDFNTGRPENDRIRFYGIDCQVSYGLADDIKAFAKKYKIDITNFNSVLQDAGAWEGVSTGRRRECTAELDKLAALVKQGFNPKVRYEKLELDRVLYAINNLMQCNELIITDSHRVRDGYMAENVKQLLGNHGADARGFIWAHNNHVAKNNDRSNMGYILKEAYGEKYYSIGFEFGKGTFYGQVNDNGVRKPKLYKLPLLKDSYAELFANADAPQFMFDMKEALSNPAMTGFLKSKKKFFNTGDSGYNPKLVGGKGDYTELYDALIFVRDVSVAKYLHSGIQLQ